MKTNKKPYLLLLTVLLLMLSAAFSATVSATDSIKYKVIVNGSIFTVKRSFRDEAKSPGDLPEQTVNVRTVDLTAIGGIHYTPVYTAVYFAPGEEAATSSIHVYEKSPTEISDIRFHYQTGTTREYRFDVFDDSGFILASAKRQITYDSAYKFNNEWIAEHNGEGLLCCSSKNFYSTFIDDNYLDVSFPNTSGYTTISDKSGNGYTQGVWTVSTDSLFARSGCASRDYLEAVGDKMYASIGFIGKEISDGYQYIQILADNETTCDDKDGDGTVGTVSTSLYKSCFELNDSNSVDKDGLYRAVFPKRYDYATNGDYPSGIGYEYMDTASCLYAQKFRNTFLRASNAGALALSPTVGSLSVRFNARGSGDDDWQFKNMFARLSIVDLKTPEIIDVRVLEGSNNKHNSTAVTLEFDEIVTYTGQPVLHTSWGDLSAEKPTDSSFANALTFTGIITANDGMPLRLNGIGGSITDLKGNALPTSFSKTVNGKTVGTTTVPQFSNGSYILTSPSDLYWYADQLLSNSALSAVLANDIDMDILYSSEFAPMCPNGFSGTFDGQGHTISGLTIKQSGTENAGLFSLIAKNGIVRGVNLDSSCIVSAYNVCSIGGIAGINVGTIEKCIFNGLASAAFSNQDGSGKGIGGIVGINDGTVQNCLVGNRTLSCAISNRAQNMTVGGVVGRNTGSITGCMFYALYNEYSMTNITRGTICGNNTGNVINCAGLHNNNNYFNGAIGAGDGTVTNVTFPESAAFFSGEVCYQINNGVTDGTQAWYQNLIFYRLPVFFGPAVIMHGEDYCNTPEHSWSNHSYEWVQKDDDYCCIGTVTCSVCGEIHSEFINGDKVDGTAPDCESAGTVNYKATFPHELELLSYGFSEQYYSETIPALGHICQDEPEYEWFYDETDRACCTGTYTCQRCGKTVTETVEADMVNIVEPTCEHEGVCRQTAVFTDPCLTTQTRYEDIDELRHNLTEWTTIAESTCTENGSMIRSCLSCGRVEYRYIPKLDHAFGAWTVTTPPTEQADGEIMHICGVCDATETSIFPKIVGPSSLAIDSRNGMLTWSVVPPDNDAYQAIIAWYDDEGVLLSVKIETVSEGDTAYGILNAVEGAQTYKLFVLDEHYLPAMSACEI